jgi:hypothetical protein
MRTQKYWELLVFARVTPLVIGDRHMRFSDLRLLLEARCCTFDKPGNNYVRIHHGPHTYKCGYPNRDFEIAVNQAKSIRRALQLDAAHGVDGKDFYDVEARIDRFVELHTDHEATRRHVVRCRKLGDRAPPVQSLLL